MNPSDRGNFCKGCGTWVPYRTKCPNCGTMQPDPMRQYTNPQERDFRLIEEYGNALATAFRVALLRCLGQRLPGVHLKDVDSIWFPEEQSLQFGLPGVKKWMSFSASQIKPYFDEYACPNVTLDDITNMPETRDMMAGVQEIAAELVSQAVVVLDSPDVQDALREMGVLDEAK